MIKQMDDIINTYENYREEDRFTRLSKRIEFVTTIRILSEHITKQSKILDCAAGTGVYAFHLAELGHNITATDITPRYVDLIRDNLKDKPYDINTAILNATDMSVFEDNYFDVVLNMGPLYHLTESDDRDLSVRECVRVLKKGGLLFSAYIPRYYVFQYIAMCDKEFLNIDLSRQLLESGIVKHDDDHCFWTDNYFATKSEMEQLYADHNLKIMDHFSQDGITPFLKNEVDNFTTSEFEIWCENHYRICREESQLGLGNHVMIVGKK